MRLFDDLENAEFSGYQNEDENPGPFHRTAYDFAARVPEFVGLVRGSDYELIPGSDLMERHSPRIEKGRLTIDPGEVGSFNKVLLVSPSSPYSRIVVEGRVQIQDETGVSAGPFLNVARIIEHRGPVENLARVPPEYWTRRTSSQINCEEILSGWCTFRYETITKARTRSVELQLLQAAREKGDAVCHFDDIVFESATLTSKEIYEHLEVEAQAERDPGDQPNHMIRVELPLPDGETLHGRYGVLLPPSTSLSFPLTIPAGPGPSTLRFHLGLLPMDSSSTDEDAVIEVAFGSTKSAARILGSFKRSQITAENPWFEARVDLASMEGQQGEMVFSSRRLTKPADDSVLPIVLSSPRIEPTQEPSDRLNVLLIGVDTLRPDRLGMNGYDRPTSPYLDDMAKQAIVFSNARSQAPWSLPSFATILTSQYPSVHRAGMGGRGLWTPVSDQAQTLAQTLAAAGYQTTGVVANIFLSPRYGLHRGFESYRWSPTSESASRDATEVSRFVDSHRSTPWFFFWHIMDPHLPYTSPPEQLSKFVDPAYEGRFSGSDKRLQVPFNELVDRGRWRREAATGPPPLPDLSAADRDFISDCYDAEIAEVDAAIGEVLQALRQSGQWQRTIVALVSDHGEGLGEHGHYHHGYTLLDDQVRIPMVVRIPGRAEGRVVDRAVGAIDLAPTLLAILGLQAPAGFQGMDLLAVDPVDRPGLILEFPSYDSSAQKALVTSDYKYLSDPIFGSEALFDLRSDRREFIDVKESRPDLAKSAKHHLDQFRWLTAQKGRYHLRVKGTMARHLSLRLKSAGLFDANVVVRPDVTNSQISLAPDRKSLEVDIDPDVDVVELVFWFRGSTIAIDGSLDDNPLLMDVGSDSATHFPTMVRKAEIEHLEGNEMDTMTPGTARLWFEAGGGASLAVMPSSSELSILEALGYLN